MIGPNFGRGCFQVEWINLGTGMREFSQIDCASRDEALEVLYDGDTGYGRVGRIVQIIERPDVAAAAQEYFRRRHAK